jgi:hypothetical protein
MQAEMFDMLSTFTFRTKSHHLNAASTEEGIEQVGLLMMSIHSFPPGMPGKRMIVSR